MKIGSIIKISTFIMPNVAQMSYEEELGWAFGLTIIGFVIIFSTVYIIDACNNSNINKNHDKIQIKFGEVGIGGKFISDSDFYVKIGDNKAYRYSDKKIIDFDKEYIVDIIVTY